MFALLLLTQHEPNILLTPFVAILDKEILSVFARKKLKTEIKVLKTNPQTGNSQRVLRLPVA